jgi:hypothetical protein
MKAWLDSALEQVAVAYKKETNVHLVKTKKGSKDIHRGKDPMSQLPEKFLFLSHLRKVQP